MIEVLEIPLEISIPQDSVRLVAMQPFIQIDASREPFQWLDSAKADQVRAILKTLDVASGRSSGNPAKFTIFPEYSIPGEEAIHVIDERLSSVDWPNDTIIIGGLHGLSKPEYMSLCQNLTFNLEDRSSPDSINDNSWVNCCIIWVKNRNGTMQRWLQPKIRPSWPEMSVRHRDMFCGSLVYVFSCQYEPSGYPCRFMTIICYDWVVSNLGLTVCDQVLLQLNNNWSGNPAPLHWVFVIQHNQGPNHPSFLNNTYQFLVDRNIYPFVEREHAVIVHANTSVSQKPAGSGNGAYTSCVFSPSAQFDCQGCRPTFCMQPSRLRKSDILNRCKDVVFREMGSCIHSFKIRVPKFVTPDATDRSHPLLDARVYGTGEFVDPRLPGGPVAASIKWLNDALDNISSLSSTYLHGYSLEVRAEEVYPAIISGMRTQPADVISDRMEWAISAFERGTKTREDLLGQNPDNWGEVQAAGLENIVYSLTALSLVYAVDTADSSLHGTLDTDNGLVQVVSIKGETHEDCRLHFDTLFKAINPDPILLIVQDRKNFVPTERELRKFYEFGDDAIPSFIDYHSLITHCRDAQDETSLKEKIDEYLPEARRII